MNKKIALFLILTSLALVFSYKIWWQKESPEAVPLNSQYKAIIFDIGGVLHTEPYQRAQVMVFLEKMYVSFLSGKPFSMMMNARQEIQAITGIDEIWDKVCKGVSEEQVAAELLEHAKQTLGKEELDSLTKEDLLKFLEYTRYYTRPIAKGMEMLREAKVKGYKTYLLSNIGKEDYEYILQRKDLAEIVDLTDAQVLSYQVGHVKPEPGIYKNLLKTYDLKPEECLFIDNKQVMIDGAKAVGIDGIVCVNHDKVIKQLKCRHVLGS